jgi:hypothetical protein
MGSLDARHHGLRLRILFRSKGGRESSRTSNQKPHARCSSQLRNCQVSVSNCQKIQLTTTHTISCLKPVSVQILYFSSTGYRIRLIPRRPEIEPPRHAFKPTFLAPATLAAYVAWTHLSASLGSSAQGEKQFQTLIQILFFHFNSKSILNFFNFFSNSNMCILYITVFRKL